MSYTLQSLVDKLNGYCRRALEDATQLAVFQTNYHVELEHLLLKLLELPDSDMQRALAYYGASTGNMTAELSRAVEKLKWGAGRSPSFAPQLSDLLEKAWLLSSLHLGWPEVRSAALLLALVDDDALRDAAVAGCKTLLKIPRDALRDQVAEVVKGSKEDMLSGRPVARTAPGTGVSAPSAASALDTYTTDLTERARAGKIDPIHGRDEEIWQLVHILMRQRQNNPILVGEAGVGKTAVAEGFAVRVAQGAVPGALKDVAVRSLDLGALQAGAGVRGEFESRVKAVLRECADADKPVILFIDEAHTLIGAGAASGESDAANLLKPALARGELRSIAATTWSEYKKYFEKDAALARRFQPVKVNEPDEAAAVEMLRVAAGRLERHHGVTIRDEAVTEAVRLSTRYIAGRKLPDKAVSVLDTACARVAMEQSGVSREIELAAQSLAGLGAEIEALARAEERGEADAERLAELRAEHEAMQAERADMERRCKEERRIVRRILHLERDLAKPGKWAAEKIAEKQAELRTIKDDLEVLQAGYPLVHAAVDGRVVAKVVSGWTGIPMGRMVRDELDTILVLREELEKRIIGQPEALETLSRHIRTYRADLLDASKPVGVFLFVGPSGVGKTETALSLAEVLYGGRRNLIVVNMSEYQESHSVASLKGAPPGYVGFGSGGVLTEAVRRSPYSVILLDEVEKAHPDVLELFYQVFDKGVMDDGEGLEVDFKHTLIILASNVGAESIAEVCAMAEGRPRQSQLVTVVKKDLLQVYKPAFLGRMVTVPYYTLGRDEVYEIVRLKLDQLRARVRENHGAELGFAPEVVATIAERSTDALAGARAIDTIVNHDLLPELSRELLLQIGYGKPLTRVHVALDRRGGFDFDFAPTAGLPVADVAARSAPAPRPAAPQADIPKSPAPRPAAPQSAATPPAPVYHEDAAPVPYDMVVPSAPPEEPEPRPAPPATPETQAPPAPDRDDAPRTLRRSDAGRSIDEISQLVPPKYKGWRQWYAELRSQFPEKDED